MFRVCTVYLMQNLYKRSRHLLFEPCHKKTCFLGFAIRYDSNRSAQLQRLTRDFKVFLKQVEVLNYLGSEQQRF